MRPRAPNVAWLLGALACAPAPEEDAGPPAAPVDTDGVEAVDSGPVDDVDTAPPVDPTWICAPDDAVCDGACRAVRFDPLACGDCGTTCGDGEVCDEGVCRAPAVAPACDAATRALVLAPATADAPAVELACSLTLSPGDVVTKKLQLVGAEASGVTLDCQGATVRKTLGAGGPDNVVVGARKVGDAAWERPTDVVVRDCRIEGSLRVQGQGLNGEGPDVQADSLTPGHRERAQLAAPTRVLLDRLTVVADGRIPVYLAPGATAVTLRDSVFTGRSVSTVVYLDAESARNTLVGNVFDVEMDGDPIRREVVAVDGSADDVIVGNTFRQPVAGGVFVYRNCGEGGTVRHQEPRRTLIAGNLFVHEDAAYLPSVWVGSRGSASLFRIYCPLDDGYPFGSSADDADFAKNTVVVGNRFVGAPLDTPVAVNDTPTVEADNVLLDAEAPGVPACARFRHEAAPRVVGEGETVGDRVCRAGGWVRAAR